MTFSVVTPVPSLSAEPVYLVLCLSSKNASLASSCGVSLGSCAERDETRNEKRVTRNRKATWFREADPLSSWRMERKENVEEDKDDECSRSQYGCYLMEQSLSRIRRYEKPHIGKATGRGVKGKATLDDGRRQHGMHGIIAEFARYVGIHIQDNLDQHLWTTKMYTRYSILGPSDLGIKIPSLGLRGYSETSHDHQSFQVEAKRY